MELAIQTIFYIYKFVIIGFNNFTLDVNSQSRYSPRDFCDINWIFAKEDESVKKIQVKNQNTNYLLVLAQGKAVTIKINYSDGKGQSWKKRHDGNSKAEADISYEFFVDKEATVNIGVVYESGNLGMCIYKHDSVRFIYLPKYVDGKLEITTRNNVVECVGVGTKKHCSRDQGVMYLEGRLLDQKKMFSEFISSFEGVLTSKGLHREDFQKVIEKIMCVV